MTNIHMAMQNFYSQFAPAYQNAMFVNEDTVFPYITYDVYATEVLEDTLSSFQVWHKANNTVELDAIADKIKAVIKPVVGCMVEVKDEIVFEWYDLGGDMWVPFLPENFQTVVQNFYAEYPEEPNAFQWRSSEGKTVGVLKLTRGSPFLQLLPIIPTEREIIRYAGNVTIRSYLLQ